MSAQVQPAKVAEVTPPPRGIMRIDLLEVVSIADATGSSFETAMGALGAAKTSTGFLIEPAKMGADGFPMPLKEGQTWDGVKLSKTLMDTIRNRRRTHVVFVPKENVRNIVYLPE